jgi:hypothetical protein
MLPFTLTSDSPSFKIDMVGNRVAGLEKVRGEMKGKEGRETHLFAPPASGLTTTQSSTLKFSLIQRNVLGSAYRLSTGTLKNPWI